MTIPSARRPAGFDYAFRPASYFEGLDSATIILSSILGEERRKDVQERLASGDFNAHPHVCGEWLIESKLDDGTRTIIGQQHPCFMGGEYLPALEQDEIEIARIVYASVTQDVISIRARRGHCRILYRIVDEYESKFNPSRKSSAKPLKLGELIDIINTTLQDEASFGKGLVFSVVVANIQGGVSPEEMRGFVTVASNFYPELEAYYEQVTGEYLDTFRNDAQEGGYEDEEAA